MQAFREVVASRLAALGWSAGDLALTLGYGSTAYVYAVLAGVRLPPLDPTSVPASAGPRARAAARLPEWLAALRMEGEPARELSLLAELEHAPTRLRRRHVELEHLYRDLRDATGGALPARQSVAAPAPERKASAPEPVAAQGILSFTGAF